MRRSTTTSAAADTGSSGTAPRRTRHLRAGTGPADLLTAELLTDGPAPAGPAGPADGELLMDRTDAAGRQEDRILIPDPACGSPGAAGEVAPGRPPTATATVAATATATATATAATAASTAAVRPGQRP